MTLTPNTHERTEWQRLAQAAYSRGVSWLDHWASVEAATGRPMLIRARRRIPTPNRSTDP
jgi:hypothetical protein